MTGWTRRRLLAATTAGLAGLSGCTDQLGSSGGGSEAGATAAPRRTAGDYGDSIAEHGRPASICTAPILEGIRAIVEPAFASDWSAVGADNEFVFGEPRLTDDHAVVGLVDGDRARAYPIAAFWRHEVVNDEFGGPVLVTYCPICRSGMVADRVVDGEALTFDASGQLWVPPDIYAHAAEADGDVFAAERLDTLEGESVRNSANLVMYDTATESYWSQMIAQAICGPHTGTELTIRPSTLATWGDWRAEHPATDVLLPAPHSRLIE